jgi:hypothetical protein
MYFRDANNQNEGKGFQNSDIYFDVSAGADILTIEPASFDANTEITITFNAAEGNKELLGTDKIYMHSSMGVIKTDNPASNAWGKVIGNWGKDDGIGLMTRVPNTNLYQIKMKPAAYYNFSPGEFPYWLAAVFRNADGSKKGTGRVGNLSNGFIAPNLDYFIRNQAILSTSNNELKGVSIYPNPSSGLLLVEGITGNYKLNVFDLSGRKMLEKEMNDYQFQLNELSPGSYIIHIIQEGKSKNELIYIYR